MTEQQILESLLSDYQDKVNPRYPFPEPYRGSGEIKAIILGATPHASLRITHSYLIWSLSWIIQNHLISEVIKRTLTWWMDFPWATSMCRTYAGTILLKKQARIRLG